MASSSRPGKETRTVTRLLKKPGSDQAERYTPINLRISTLIGEAGCWLHAGYHKAIGSNHTESHIPHGKEVPQGACWIIAPSPLLLHHWDAGMEGKLDTVLSCSVRRFLFDTHPAGKPRPPVGEHSRFCNCTTL